MTRNKKLRAGKRVGGLFFFLALLVFVLVSGAAIFTLPAALYDASWIHLGVLASGILLGALGARLIVRAHLSVFLHELKHMIVAVLAGNRPKGMKVSRDSGHFEYAYSEETAGYNAFISLAPYYLPLFSAPSIPVAYYLLREDPISLSLVVGVALGVDLLLNLRDISPHQTDFSGLTGGFFVGLLYVLSLNCIIVCTVVVLVSSGLEGLQEFFWGIFSRLTERSR